ncbi:hypothetical protein DAPPUDRAFT_245200 [Daphnia pulex]|uniref:CUB domain-containing protein n=1 Tax=Daphnia pulex TaxID=6669 RepID=E9GMS7_DAPPU|nr:hypothetical protein DAPPUDRAFT_245200 [Daphnia pulex]|eukprot:EFX79238.1 hypothetical protein DAPPUDRAFT_245200 [Daphnia pulex]
MNFLDCLGGSDEHYDCEYSKSCSQLTRNVGRFSSAPVTPPNENIHKNHWKNLVRKSVVLITVQANHIIWLAFNKFRTTENRFLKVYDGPYSTSPLLLSHSGTTKPHPVRSSSNNLYVEFPSYYDQSYGVEVFYTSMNTTDLPFVSGCGGYIYGDGEVTSPDKLSSLSDITPTVQYLVGEKGTLKSPNYPATYPDSSDFRWNIVTAPHTKIQLFALLETQEEFDYLYMYDGPTINSQLLLEKSGSEPLPFAVNSSTNEVLVRLTSDEAKAFPGFLAVYSTL